MQSIGVWLIPYTAKIETGNMNAAGFLVAYVGLSMLYNVMEALQDLVGSIGKADLSRNVRKRMWRKMLHLPMTAYQQEEPQRMVSRVTTDTEYAYGALSALIQIVTVIYGCVAALYQVYLIYAELTWIMLAMIPAIFICTIIVGKIQFVMDRMMNDAYSSMTNFYAERLPNIAFIKANGMEKKELERAKRVNQEKYKTDVKYKGLFMVQQPLTSIANYVGMIFVLWMASAMVRAGQMEMAQLISLYAYFDLVMQNAVLVLGVWQAFKYSHGGTARIAEIDSTPEEDLSGTLQPQGGKDIIFRNVSFAYDAAHPVLRDVSFTIPHGQVTAIIGENGCGKSTIAKLLERFDVPKSGTITLGSDDLQALDGVAWRDRLGMVFQENQTVKGTVAENIGYGLRREVTQSDLELAAENAVALDFIREKPEGFQTQVGLFDSEFSGGQLQRLALARLMLKNPDYFLLDEATTGVDADTERAIFRNLTDLARGKTVIIISHDMSLVEQADYIVALQDGVVEAEGAQADMRSRSRVYQGFLAETEA